MKMRFASFLFALMLIITMIPQWAMPVSAAYENTYVNTGNQAADILGVALTQVGYVEGSGNRTKYGEWYGMNGEAWCGMFVSWCANQAGIPSSVLPKYARSNPEGWGLKRLDGATYRPKPGDLFFKKNLSHVGLVYYLDGDYFYTLEGNAGSAPHSVCIRKRLIKDFYFGSPNYKGGAEHSYTTGYDTTHPHKEYKICSHCSDKYYTGKTQSVDTCTECIQAACSHTYSAWAESGKEHTRTCSKCNKTEVKSHNWNTGTITKQPTCAQSGSKDQTCKDCGAKRTVSIPKTDTHKFSEHEYVDEQNHKRTCSVCKKTETEAHAENEAWSTDHAYHWYACEVCNDRYQQQEHNFPNGCESACSVCGYLSPAGHVPSEKALFDDDGHWYVCQVCNLKIQYNPHTFSAECAEICESCDYRRETIHTFSAELISDESGHWLQCNVCGEKADISQHVPDTAAKDWEDQTCVDCGYIIRSAAEHVHQYHTVHSDGEYHWGSCGCGYEMPKQAHNWSMRSQTCSVCERHANDTGVNITGDHSLHWWLIGIGSLAIVSGLTVLCLRIGKKRPVKVA